MSLLNWMSARSQSKTMDGIDTELALVRNVIGTDPQMAAVFFDRFTTVIGVIDALQRVTSAAKLTAAISNMPHHHRVPTATNLLQLGIGRQRERDLIGAAALKMLAMWIHLVDLIALPETNARNAFRADNLIKLHEALMDRIAADISKEG